MENNGNNKSRKKSGRDGYIYFGCVGGVYFFIKADGGLKDLNLGQLHNNMPKYLCTDDFGRNTGSGQAFEDVFYKICKSAGSDICKVEEMKNGVDFYLDGIPCQLKYGRSAKSVFQKMFDKKTGEYRYPGQTIITNVEIEGELRELIELNQDRFKGEQIIINPAGTPKITRKKVDEQFRRGFASLKLDAKDIITDSGSQKKIAIGILVSFCTIIGLGAIVEYRKIESSEKATVKKIGKAVRISFRKHWKKGLAASLATAGVIFCKHLYGRQMLRPK
ncbi:MAG: hypothetical protein K2M06_08245 [Muribaculaceae bacterium]|nr:hypothetical protein [Muribaculaceae bacterium]